MIPIIAGMEAQGINVTPLFGVWPLVWAWVETGLTSADANVFIVTISEKWRRWGIPLAITPGLWMRKGLPVMLVTDNVHHNHVCFLGLFLSPIETATVVEAMGGTSLISGFDLTRWGVRLMQSDACLFFGGLRCACASDQSTFAPVMSGYFSAKTPWQRRPRSSVRRKPYPSTQRRIPVATGSDC